MQLISRRAAVWSVGLLSRPGRIAHARIYVPKGTHIPAGCRGLGLFSSPPPKVSAAQLCEQVQAHYTETLAPLNAKLHGPLEAASEAMLPLPMVLVIGNHSSGKSTFINFLLGRSVQQTGVAPTDDAFSIIAPGRDDLDQDGPSLIGDPTLGFGGLSQFGGQLANHVRLKIRSQTRLKVGAVAMRTNQLGTSGN